MEEEKTSRNRGSRDLEAEASEIRREKLFGRRKSTPDSGIVNRTGGGSLWRFLSAIAAIVVILAAVVLLAIPGLRTGISEQLAEVFIPGPDNTLYELPAPPPKAPNVTEQYREADGFDPEEGILYSGGTPQPEKVEPFGGEKIQVGRQDLAFVIEARVEEVFKLILQAIQQSGYDGLLPAGIVLTGGTAQLRGITDVAERVLNVPARVANPRNLLGLVDDLHSPAYATGVGLLQWARSGSQNYRPRVPQRRQFGRRVGTFLRAFLPG